MSELVEIKSSLEEVLEINSIDWLSEDEKNLIVLESQQLGINNSEDLASHVLLDSETFKSSLQ